ncbi:hypothetical protein [Aeromonas sp. MdU4]|uniref:hypothetical protein n=1 Tax=Aeromonas sp. MdU4 TaxID=3342819 RepID=UPI0035B8D2A0
MAQTLRVVAGLLLLYISGCYALPEGAEQAVAQSLNIQDYRLIVRGGRGGGVPGIAESEQEQAKNRCGVRYLAGFADVITPGKEAEYAQLEAYATDYNRRMLPHCQKPEK